MLWKQWAKASPDPPNLLLPHLAVIVCHSYDRKSRQGDDGGKLAAMVEVPVRTVIGWQHNKEVTMPESLVAAPAPQVQHKGCPVHQLREELRRVGLRPTRQRISLGWLLFAKGDRHVTAEMLYEEATRARVPVSLATVYNTLHQFTEAGLLRELAVDGSKTYFDTNVADHHHFFIEDDDNLIDIPGSGLSVVKVPELPEGMEVSKIDVIVRLRRKL